MTRRTDHRGNQRYEYWLSTALWRLRLQWEYVIFDVSMFMSTMEQKNRDNRCPRSSLSAGRVMKTLLGSGLNAWITCSTLSWSIMDYTWQNVSETYLSRGAVRFHPRRRGRTWSPGAHGVEVKSWKRQTGGDAGSDHYRSEVSTMIFINMTSSLT